MPKRAINYSLSTQYRVGKGARFLKGDMHRQAGRKAVEELKESQRPLPTKAVLWTSVTFSDHRLASLNDISDGGCEAMLLYKHQ